MKIKRLSRTLIVPGLSVLVTVTMDAVAAPACATLETMPNDHWVQSTGSSPANGPFFISDSGGRLTGGYSENSGGNCPAGTTFSIIGVMNNNGTYTFSATVDHPTSGCQNFVANGSVSGVACNVTTYNYFNADGTAGTNTYTHACYAPTGETKPQFLGWGLKDPALTDTGDTGQQTVATFIQYLNPTFYNWGGRTIRELSPSTPTGVDSCWYDGNPLGLSQYTTVTGNAIQLSGSDFTPGGSPYKDDIGPTQAIAAYWRKLKRAPCGSTVYQNMAAQCDGGLSVFVQNKDAFGIDSAQVKASRGTPADPTTVARPWAPSAALNAAISKILSQQ